MRSAVSDTLNPGCEKYDTLNQKYHFCEKYLKRAHSRNASALQLCLTVFITKLTSSTANLGLTKFAVADLSQNVCTPFYTQIRIYVQQKAGFKYYIW